MAFSSLPAGPKPEMRVEATIRIDNQARPSIRNEQQLVSDLQDVQTAEAPYYRRLQNSTRVKKRDGRGWASSDV